MSMLEKYWTGNQKVSVTLLSSDLDGHPAWNRAGTQHIFVEWTSSAYGLTSHLFKEDVGQNMWPLEFLRAWKWGSIVFCSSFKKLFKLIYFHFYSVQEIFFLFVVVVVVCLFYLHGTWDLSSPTRDQIHVPCSESWVLTTRLPGKFQFPVALQFR